MISTSPQSLTVIDAIESRRSIRKYADTPVPESDIREILRLAAKAPSAWNLQPWRFGVVRGPEIKAKLYRAAYEQRQVASAPVVIVMWSDMNDVLSSLDEVFDPTAPPEVRERQRQNIAANFAAMTDSERADWGAAQSYIALGFLLIAARSLGYDTCPMLGFDAEQVKEILGLPRSARIPAIVTLGIRAEEGYPSVRHNLERTVTWK